jgi:hypothetical protein
VLLLLLALLLSGRRALDGPQHGRSTGRRLIVAGCSPMRLLLQLLCCLDAGPLQGGLLRRCSDCSAGCLSVLQRLTRRGRCRCAWGQLVALWCAVRAAKQRDWHVRRSCSSCEAAPHSLKAEVQELLLRTTAGPHGISRTCTSHLEAIAAAFGGCAAKGACVPARPKRGSKQRL